MAFNLIDWSSVSGLYFVVGPTLEKYEKFRTNCYFYRWIQLDWRDGKGR